MKPAPMKPAKIKSVEQRHSRMVLDRLRTPLLEKAVSHLVKPGDTVFDLGCGLGILSFAAVKAGAKRVYACDVDKTALTRARQTARVQGYESKIFFLEGLSSDIGLPEKVDVILAETVGSLGLDENIVPFVIDARNRFLKKGGKILPDTLRVFLAPIDLTRFQIPATQSKWKKIVEVPFQMGTVSPKNLLAAGKKFASVEFLSEKFIGFDAEISFRAQRDGTLTGFAGWFECDWTPTLTTSTAPDQPTTHWQQALLPIKEKTAIKKGQTLLFRLRIFPKEGPTSPQSAIEWGYRI